MHASKASVHASTDIEKMLSLGLSPITDNVEALMELGFARSYPSARTGYESTVFERSVDRGYRDTSQGMRRVMVCQRAFLITEDPAPASFARSRR